MNRNIKQQLRWLVPSLLLAMVLVVPQSFAADESSTAQTLDADVQQLKEELILLNRDLFLLEEELLFPSSTQVAIFISMNVGELFALDSVKIELDGKEVANYLYTEREISALHRGGVHKIFIGNQKAGDHELVAFFIGKGPSGRDYKRGTELTFEKELGPKYLELKIDDSSVKRQPEFVVREW